jgi:hypothetical protein
MPSTRIFTIAFLTLLLLNGLAPQLHAAVEWRIHPLEPGQDLPGQDDLSKAVLAAPPPPGPAPAVQDAPLPSPATPASAASSEEAERAKRRDVIKTLTLFEPDSPEALPALLGLLGVLPPTDKGHAILALSELIKTPEQLEPILPELVNAGADENAGVRVAAMTATVEARKKFPQIAQRLLALAAFVEEWAPERAQGLAVLLGALGAEAAPAVPALVKLLNAEDERSRLCAAFALAAITRNTSPEAVPVLALVAGDQTLPLPERLAAVRVLKAYGPSAKLALPALLRVSRDEQRMLRPVALEAVGQIVRDGKNNPPEVVSGLLLSVGEEDVQLKMLAILALGSAGPETPGIAAVAPVLETILAATAPDSLAKDAALAGPRRCAAWTLTRLDPARFERMSEEQKAWVAEIEAKITTQPPRAAP